jgi:hypothetical protein
MIAFTTGFQECSGTGDVFHATCTLIVPMNCRPVLLAVSVCTSALCAQHKPSKTANPASQVVADSQLYRNVSFGFRYKMPYGWVDRTKDMQEGNETGKGEILLAVFERPPQAAGDTVNSAVVIARESAATYPGLKRAEDYLGPLNDVTVAKGFKSAGDPAEIMIGGRTLIRADFRKALNEKLMMHQSTLVLLQKGQIVSFTFIAGSEEEIEQLVENLGFGATRIRPQPVEKR